MKKCYIVGVVIGLLILFFSVPLGELYGGIYLLLSGGMESERYIMLSQSAITSIQIIGGIVSALCGIANICYSILEKRSK